MQKEKLNFLCIENIAKGKKKLNFLCPSSNLAEDFELTQIFRTNTLSPEARAQIPKIQAMRQLQELNVGPKLNIQTTITQHLHHHKVSDLQASFK